MREEEKVLLKSKIDKAELISFDIFDTLLFRKTNTPEIVFDLVGKHFGIHGFRKLRMDEQNEASRRAYAAYEYPHADMDQIYEVLAEHIEIPVDWNEVKEYEIQLERDALVANKEMLEFFNYAKNQGKRVVATSDMYLFAETLSVFLQDNGFEGFDYIYCSADEHKAKFNKELFELVAEKENVAYENILHIGDKERDDGEYPGSFGMQTFIYNHDADLDKVKNTVCSDVDNGLYKILYDNSKGFWYNLGVEVGGPLYMGLYQYMLKNVANKGQKIFFLARDGYNLYHIFKNQGYENIEYLYTSRRALTMATITQMNERDIELLPPYTYGQTVGEILDYLCIDRSRITHLKETGFQSFEDVIGNEQDIHAFKKLYIYDKEVFLERCHFERENALKYFNAIGFLEQDAICFDCGWQGSSQELIESFKECVGCNTKTYFVYFGIKNSDKSRKQLHGMHYDTYLFDFYSNYALHEDVDRNVVMYELFFSAPHESVFYYDEDGKVVFESGQGDQEKAEILDGICDFIREGWGFVEQYDVEYTPEIAVGHIKRLIHLPTEEEAIAIGDLQNVDGFTRKQGEEKYIAKVTLEQLENNFVITELYWPKGLFKRPDISEEIKAKCALMAGIPYPEVVSEYHLEDTLSIRNYNRWINFRGNHQETVREYTYKPFFSIVIPVYNTISEQLEECIQSVLEQTYGAYELILVDDCSTWGNVVPILQKYEQNAKIRVIYRSVNGHISAATNDGIQAAVGDYIVFMDCDDTIEPNALDEFAGKLNENPELDFIYSDEDKITEDGKIRHMPFFKPDWSPDLFLNMNYTNHMSVYRASIVKAIGGLRTAYNGSQDYDFVLRFMEHSEHSKVGHISKILYHWRERKESVAYAISSKNYAAEAARNAKEDYIRRNKIPAHLEYIAGISQYRIVYEVTSNPLVSIIIPSKDHPDILKQCIDSIRAFTNYKNYEIIVVDNGSSVENRAIIEKYLCAIGAMYIYEKAPFNYPMMCNMGVAHAKGTYYLFLNDDIEVFQPEWLEKMLGYAQQKHVGAVGAKLYYPMTTLIQHGGVNNHVEGPIHNFCHLDDRYAYYFGWNRVDINCIAVTGACLLIDKQKYEEVGGFDEKLAVNYNDIKLCFSLLEKGYYNVLCNDVVAYHYESLSRGSGITMDEQKVIRSHKERMYLSTQFNKYIGKDPYLNEHLKQYTNGLDLKKAFDNFNEIDIEGCELTDNAYIDYLDIGHSVRLLGWSVPASGMQPETLKHYVIFQDPFGKTYGAETLPYPRPDIAEHMGLENYENAGFECVVDRDNLKVEVVPYKLGVMTIDGDGKRYLKMCRETNIMRNKRQMPFFLGNTKLENFEMHPQQVGMCWDVSECTHYDGYYKIQGFAFIPGGINHLYRKSLILSEQDGSAYEFEVQLQQRLDVAYTFPKEHYLYYTGFVCYIYDDVLEKEKDYRVCIRLTNQFDENEILDIDTGKQVTI